MMLYASLVIALISVPSKVLSDSLLKSKADKIYGDKLACAQDSTKMEDYLDNFTPDVEYCYSNKYDENDQLCMKGKTGLTERMNTEWVGKYTEIISSGCTSLTTPENAYSRDIIVECESTVKTKGACQKKTEKMGYEFNDEGKVTYCIEIENTITEEPCYNEYEGEDLPTTTADKYKPSTETPRYDNDCPPEAPASNTKCNFVGHCNYGEEICCGETHPKLTCSCTSLGLAHCYYAGRCMNVKCGDKPKTTEKPYDYKTTEPKDEYNPCGYGYEPSEGYGGYGCKPITAKPTRKPTPSPSGVPSKSPTPKPSTKWPTPTPTDVPSKSPTPKPSGVPSKSPTPKPSTKWPTPTPTDVPSKSPTERPTKYPSKEPTEEPTKWPTNKPTPAPTAWPTKNPTANPTPAPTGWPTKSPTKAPTDWPTKNPTAEPTPWPTKPPTNKPTDWPTKYPTDEPTKAPTGWPTKSPTTKKPTPCPTDKPTTEEPTAWPTKSPTTKEPTPWPTKVPTTKKPTVWPTGSPTAKPSEQPTKSPIWTKEPTMSPVWTKEPTKKPTTDKPTQPVPQYGYEKEHEYGSSEEEEEPEYDNEPSEQAMKLPNGMAQGVGQWI